MTLLDKVNDINTNILEQNDNIITKDFLFENISLDDISNTQQLNILTLLKDLMLPIVLNSSNKMGLYGINCF